MPTGLVIVQPKAAVEERPGIDRPATSRIVVLSGRHYRPANGANSPWPPHQDRRYYAEVLGQERTYDVLAIDDMDVVRSGLITMQHAYPNAIRSMRVLGHPDDVDYASSPPDVVVLDFWLEKNKKPATPHITRLRDWSGAVILYTSEDRTGILRGAVEAGIDGLCLKSDGMEQLAAGIRRVASGSKAVSGPLARAIMAESEMEAILTSRQYDVLSALALGLKYNEIAEHLFISIKTVNRHVEDIFTVYKELVGADDMNRNRLLREAIRRGDVVDPWREDGEFPRLIPPRNLVDFSIGTRRSRHEGEANRPT